MKTKEIMMRIATWLVCLMFIASAAGAGVLDSPVPLTPESTSKTFLPFPQFTWKAHPQAFQAVAKPVSYDIQIARDRDFQSLVDEDTVFLNRYVHDRPLAPAEYFWRVRTRLYGENPTPWSEGAQFSIMPCDAEIKVEFDSAAPDHAAAVEAALARVRQLGRSGRSVRLVFPIGKYRFDKRGALLNLDGLHDLIVDGGGSTVSALRHNSGLITARGAANLVVMGFVVDFPDERTFLEGRVENVEPKTGRITVRLNPGCPGYDVPYVKRGAGPSFLSLLDPQVDGRLKAGGYNAYFFDQIVPRADGAWTLTLKRPEVARYFNTGDRFVHFIRETGCPLNIIHDSRQVTFYDITSYATSSLHYAAIEGSLLNILHCRWKIAPGRWFSGNADGVHCRGYSIGPWIEHCEIQAIGDDGIALYARPSTVAETQPGGKKNACVCNANLFNLAAGDEVSFFVPQTGRILTECRVLSVEKRPDGKWLVVFDRDLPGGLVTQGDMQNVTQIWNRSKSSGDFVIRHNTIRNIRRFGTVFRARRGVVEENTYEAASCSGILFENEPQYPNGLYCSDIIIRHNTLKACSFDRYTRPPITMVFHKLGSQVAADIGPRRILIEKNTFVDCPMPEVGLYSTRDVLLRGNVARHGGEAGPIKIQQHNTERVTFQP